MKTIAIMAGVAALSALAAIPAHATGFVGDTVNLSYYFPDSGSLYEDDGNQAVSPTASFTSFGQVVTDVSSNQISVDAPGLGSSYSSAAFNGVVLTDLTNSHITGVTVDPASTEPGFDISRVSFTSNSVSINLQGLEASDPSAIVDVQFSAVPEPASWAMMLVGLGGLGAMTRARRQQVAANA